MTNQTGTEELLACPFCGATDIKVARDSTAYIGGVDAIAYCKKCGANGANKKTLEEAATAWNRRLSAPPLSDERLREIRRQKREAMEKEYHAQPGGSLAFREKYGTFNYEEVAALEALREVSRLTGPGGTDAWQDISTAPKDETSIIVYDPDDELEARVKVVFWNNHLSDWQCWVDTDSIKRLTHWQPLPEPPAALTPPKEM